MDIDFTSSVRSPLVNTFWCCLAFSRHRRNSTGCFFLVYLEYHQQVVKQVLAWKSHLSLLGFASSGFASSGSEGWSSFGTGFSSGGEAFLDALRAVLLLFALVLRDTAAFFSRLGFSHESSSSTGGFDSVVGSLYFDLLRRGGAFDLICC